MPGRFISNYPLALVEYFASWCEPCKWAVPVLNDLTSKYEGKMSFHTIDIDLHPDLARDQHILSVPTVVLYKDQKEIWRMRGFDTVNKMKEEIDIILQQV